jgi:HSP20 family protein
MLTRWSNLGLRDLGSTFAALDQMRRDMDAAFGGSGRDPLFSGHFAGRADWPRVELYDTGSALVVRAELPGFAQDDIDINVHQGVLTLKAHRKDDAPEGYTAHRRERGAATFTRSFSIPCRIDLDRTAATLSDGVLTLTMDKAAEVKPRQIQVKAS